MNKNPQLSEERFWFAFYTKSRHEFKASNDFNSYGVEYYLPTVIRLKQWSDRKKKVKEPLFKGYIFAKVNEAERINLLKSNAIVNTVSFSGKPAHIQEFEIENLKRILSNQPEVTVTNKIKSGSRVVINSGPFEGVKGIVFKNENSENMLAVTCELLQRSVIVRLPVYKVKEVAIND